MIENEELHGFLKDLLDLVYEVRLLSSGVCNVIVSVAYEKHFQPGVWSVLIALRKNLSIWLMRFI